MEGKTSHKLGDLSQKLGELRPILIPDLGDRSHCRLAAYVIRAFGGLRRSLRNSFDAYDPRQLDSRLHTCRHKAFCLVSFQA